MNPNVKPLSGSAPTEVRLPRAPLSNVICQVRFPPILAISREDRVAQFQEEIRGQYPFLSEDIEHELNINPAGGAPTFKNIKIWRFMDNETNPAWRVSLGQGFVSLDTSKYANRTDFLDRLNTIFSVTEKQFKPAQVRRLGIRYIDRLKDTAVSRIGSLIQPTALGIAAPSKDGSSGFSEALLHLLTEGHFQAKEGRLKIKWGNVPPHSTPDPATIEPWQKNSWILDFDMFSEQPFAFQTPMLLARSTQFCERIYWAFRQMITDEFLKFYGADGE
jgi:uncharacterized protein (TIGR04255 family)